MTDERFRPSRRNVLTGSAAFGAATILGFRPAAVLAQTDKPLRIGLINSFSGTFAFLARSNVNGLTLYLDQHQGKLGGRTVEVIKEDDEINPQIGLQKLRKLVESDKVDLILGPQASNVGMALLNYEKANKIFVVVNGAGAVGITKARLPYLYRTSLSTTQVTAPMAQWVYDNIAKEIVLTASDFAGGRDVISTFKTAYEKIGGRVIKEVYPPLGTADFSPYLTDLRTLGAPATYNFYAGTDAVRFVKQYDEAGLKKTTKLIGHLSVVDADTIGAQGDSAIGCISGNFYADTLATPENTAFVAAYRKAYDDYPNLYSDHGYTTAMAVDMALQQTKGDVADKNRLAAAMATVSIKAPRGPVRFDPQSHNIIQNLYVFEAARLDGRIAGKLLATIPDVNDPNA